MKQEEVRRTRQLERKQLTSHTITPSPVPAEAFKFARAGKRRFARARQKYEKKMARRKEVTLKHGL